MNQHKENNSGPQHLGPAQQPWETSDGILAFCLYLAGVPFLTTRNLYTADTLRALGFSGETDLLEAANQCVAARKKGNLKYLFRRPRELKRLLGVFTDQERRLADENGEAAEVIHALMEEYSAKTIDLHEALMRVACIVLKLRGGFMNRWRDRPPLVQIDNPGRPRSFETTATIRTARGTKTVPAKGVQYPGFKIISTNASEETKKKLGLA